MAKPTHKPKKPPKPESALKSESRAKRDPQKASPGDPVRAAKADEDDATDEAGVDDPDQGESDAGVTIAAPPYGHL